MKKAKSYGKKPSGHMPPQHGPLGSTAKPIGPPKKPIGPTKLKAAKPDTRQAAANAKGRVLKRKDLASQVI
jgi:hypothetical protein